MEIGSIKIRKRQDVGGSSGGRLRHHGQIPAVFYGGEQQSIPAHVEAKELKAFLRKNGRNTVFQTEFAGELDVPVLIKEIQYDPVNKEIVHLDLQRVREDERIEVDVPVRFLGIDAVSRVGNVVIHQKDTVRVECLPKNIPKVADADVSDVKPGHFFTAGDLKFPPAISLLSKPGEILATVSSVRQEAEEPEESAAAVSAEGSAG